MQAEASTRSDKFTFRPSLGLRLWRGFLRALFRIIFRVLCKVEISGMENVPREGGYIIAYNHVSLFEPPLVLAFWPKPPEAIAGADVFERPGQKILVRSYRAIPVHRGEYDRKAMDTMMEVINAELPLAIAPEGTRSRKPGLQRGRSGVAYIVDRTGAPVVPVGLSGTTGDVLRRALRLKRPHLVMNIGKPFRVPPIKGRGKERRESRQRNADLVMEHIATLLPEEYRGVYA